MGKLIFSVMTSLDGYIEADDPEREWAIVDEELHTYVNDRVRAAGALLYGRRTYDVMAGYWPTADEDPSAPEFELDFARIWKRVPKVVFSRTLERADWNTRVVADDIPGEVARLKEQIGGELILGGADVASTLMGLGLVDELEIYAHPVVVGGGKPLFKGSAAVRDLARVETRRFGSGSSCCAIRSTRAPNRASTGCGRTGRG
jgi:dihydrofolate reductase